MDTENNKSHARECKVVAIAVVAVVVAGLLGWKLGHSGSSSGTIPASSTQTTTKSKSVMSSSTVDSIANYTLPDGWKKNVCEGNDTIFVAPNGTTSDCNSNPTASVTLSVNSGNIKDCNQLQNIPDVKKHICISLYINGLRSLKASTEYLASSSYNQATTVNAYYIDTGKGVVKVEYTFTSVNQFQTGFDQLATSVTVKD